MREPSYVRFLSAPEASRLLALDVALAELAAKARELRRDKDRLTERRRQRKGAELLPRERDELAAIEAGFAALKTQAKGLRADRSLIVRRGCGRRHQAEASAQIRARREQQGATT